MFRACLAVLAVASMLGDPQLLNYAAVGLFVSTGLVLLLGSKKGPWF